MALLLAGYRRKDTALLLGLTKKQLYRTRQSRQRRAPVLLGLEEHGATPSPRRRAAQKAARAGWGRPPAFRVPDGGRSGSSWPC
ncbi:MAG: hypothetical protein Q8O76_07865 [Chloroflexota bacterium]|nr:hypothetical protein [Chloroflexota bacterium]